ncbi:MAG: C cytochrome precursor, partial [Pirellulaceae bacterium]
IHSPSVARHLQTGHPNACNLCHLDKSLQWTSEHLTQWYGQPAVELDKAQKTVAASVQMLLSGDAVQRIVVAWHMGWKPAWEASGKNWQIPLLAQLLQDPYSAVRFVAHESMKKLPGYQQLQAATEYDFIAPPNERKQFQDAFLQRWQASKPRAPENPAAILWNEDGTLKAETILKLLQQRDDRKILLAE